MKKTSLCAGEAYASIAISPDEVFHCTGSPTGYAKVPSDLLYAQELAPDHIMWASEYPYCFPMTAGIDALENIEGLTEEFKNKLFYENAKAFYGF